VRHELMGLFEITRGLGASYRFASSDPGAGVFYGRVTMSFCRFIAAGIARHALRVPKQPYRLLIARRPSDMNRTLRMGIAHRSEANQLRMRENG